MSSPKINKTPRILVVFDLLKLIPCSYYTEHNEGGSPTAKVLFPTLPQHIYMYISQTGHCIIYSLRMHANEAFPNH